MTVAVRADVGAIIVRSFFAAHEDAAVGGGPEIMDVGAFVFEPLTSLPANRCPLSFAETCGEDDVGIKGNQQAPEFWKLHRICVRGEDHLVCLKDALLGMYLHFAGL